MHANIKIAIRLKLNLIAPVIKTTQKPSTKVINYSDIYKKKNAA